MVEIMLHTFEATIKFVQDSITDLTEKEMVEQPIGLPNHGKWIVGHLIFSCQGMAVELGINPWLPEEWESNFGYGSKPISDSGHYPKKMELHELLNNSKERLKQAIVNLGESELTKSLEDESFHTLFHLLLQVVVAHTAYHAGQLASWRRAIGKKSVSVFV